MWFVARRAFAVTASLRSGRAAVAASMHRTQRCAFASASLFERFEPAASDHEADADVDTFGDTVPTSSSNSSSGSSGQPLERAVADDAAIVERAAQTAAKILQRQTRGGRQRSAASLDALFLHHVRARELSTRGLDALLRRLLEAATRDSQQHAGQQFKDASLGDSVLKMMKLHAEVGDAASVVALWQHVTTGACGTNACASRGAAVLAAAIDALSALGRRAEVELLFSASRTLLTFTKDDALLALRSANALAADGASTGTGTGTNLNYNGASAVLAAVESNNLPPATAAVFEAMIRHHVRADRVHEAGELIAGMSALSLPFSRLTFEPILDFHCDKGNVLAALALLDTMWFQLHTVPSNPLLEKLVATALRTGPAHGGGVHFAAALLMRAEIVKSIETSSQLRQLLQQPEVFLPQLPSFRMHFVDLQLATRALDEPPHVPHGAPVSTVASTDAAAVDAPANATDATSMVLSDLRTWWQRIEAIAPTADGRLAAIPSFVSHMNPDVRVNNQTAVTRFPIDAFLAFLTHLVTQSAATSRASPQAHSAASRLFGHGSASNEARALQLLIYACRLSVGSPERTQRRTAGLTARMRKFFVAQNYRAALLVAAVIQPVDVTMRTSLLQGLLGRTTLSLPSYARAATLLAESAPLDRVGITPAMLRVLAPLRFDRSGKATAFDARLAALMERYAHLARDSPVDNSTPHKSIDLVHVYGFMRQLIDVRDNSLPHALRFDALFQPCADWLGAHIGNLDALWADRVVARQHAADARPAVDDDELVLQLPALDSTLQSPEEVSRRSGESLHLFLARCARLVASGTVSVAALMAAVRPAVQQYAGTRRRRFIVAESAVVLVDELCMVLLRARAFAAAWQLLHDAHRADARSGISGNNSSVRAAPAAFYSKLMSEIFGFTGHARAPPPPSEADVRAWQRAIDAVCAARACEPVSIRAEEQSERAVLDVDRLLSDVDSRCGADTGNDVALDSMLDALSLSEWDGESSAAAVAKVAGGGPAVPLRDRMPSLPSRAALPTSTAANTITSTPSLKADVDGLAWYALEPSFEHAAPNGAASSAPTLPPPIHSMLADVFQWSMLAGAPRADMLEDLTRFYTQTHFPIAWAVWSCWTHAARQHNEEAAEQDRPSSATAIRHAHFLFMLRACRNLYPAHPRHALAVSQQYAAHCARDAPPGGEVDANRTEAQNIAQWAHLFAEFERVLERRRDKV